MKRQYQAMLRSALIFPGAGQLFLGRRRRAVLFALPTLAAAIYFLTDLMVPIQALADKLALEIMEDGMIDIADVLARVHQLSLADNTSLNLSVYAIVGLWAGSIVDAWMLGR